MWLGIKLEGWLTIAAITIGPILALAAQRELDKLREAKKRKILIFRNLMTTRSVTLAAIHVEALNAIDVEFFPPKGKNKRVVEAWRIYAEHLNKTKSEDPDTVARWDDKRTELLVELLYEMAQCLGFYFDKVTLKRTTYYPSGLFEGDMEGVQLRKAAVAVFEGRTPILIKETAATPAPPMARGVTKAN